MSADRPDDPDLHREDDDDAEPRDIGEPEAKPEQEDAEPDPRPNTRDQYDTEEIRFMQGLDDEVLAVRLSGPHAGPDRITTSLASAFLAKLGHLASTMSTELAVRHLGFASATFDLAPAPDQTANLFPELTSNPERVGQTIVDLIQASARSEEEAISTIRELGQKPARAFIEVLEVLEETKTTSSWRAHSGQSATLTAPEASWLLAVFGAKREAGVHERVITGTLYLANANAKKFRLQPDDDDRKVLGTYPPALEPIVGEYWSKRVRATLRVTEYEIAATGEIRPECELTELEPAPGLI